MFDFDREAGITIYDTELEKIRKRADYEADLSRERQDKWNETCRQISKQTYIPGIGSPEPFDTVKGMVGYGLFPVIAAIVFNWSTNPTFYALRYYWIYAIFMVLLVTVKAIYSKNANLKLLLKITLPMLFISAVIYFDSYYYWGLLRAFLPETRRAIFMTSWAAFIPALYCFAKVYNSGRKKK